MTDPAQAAAERIVRPRVEADQWTVLSDLIYAEVVVARIIHEEYAPLLQQLADALEKYRSRSDALAAVRKALGEA